MTPGRDTVAPLPVPPPEPWGCRLPPESGLNRWIVDWLNGLRCASWFCNLPLVNYPTIQLIYPMPPLAFHASSLLPK